MGTLNIDGFVGIVFCRGDWMYEFMLKGWLDLLELSSLNVRCVMFNRNFDSCVVGMEGRREGGSCLICLISWKCLNVLMD